ncbi:MAG: hypothetical protein AAF318_11415 [Pseudomonadota bacterium]
MSPILAHTVTKLAGARGHVVICGSHGGTYAGEAAAAAGVAAILLNDAGIGKNRAGVAGLAILEQHGIAAAAISHASCRIGNADSAAATGVLSTVNAPARALGVREGDAALTAAETLAAAAPPSATITMGEEHRTERMIAGRRLVLIDSVSLVRPEDEGALVISGSHGGLVGDDPASAGRADAFLFAYNDAGLGAEEAGAARLPVLEGRGIAAVTVSHESAEIGLAHETFHGLISRANPHALALGLLPGTRLSDGLAALPAP